MLEGFLKDSPLHREVEVYELHYADSTLQQLSLLLVYDGIDDCLVLDEEDSAEDGEDNEDDAQPVSGHRAVNIAGKIFPLEYASSVKRFITDEPDHQGAQLKQLSLY